MPRSHDYTTKLQETFDPHILWDDYGIVTDVIVSYYRLSFVWSPRFCVQLLPRGAID